MLVMLYLATQWLLFHINELKKHRPCTMQLSGRKKQVNIRTLVENTKQTQCLSGVSVNIREIKTCTIINSRFIC